MTQIEMIWHDRSARELAKALDGLVATFDLPKEQGYPSFSVRDVVAGPGVPNHRTLRVSALARTGVIVAVFEDLLQTISFDDPNMPCVALENIRNVTQALRTLPFAAEHYLGSPAEPWFLAAAVVAQQQGQTKLVSLPSPWTPFSAECDKWDAIHIPDDVRDRFTKHAPKGISIATLPTARAPIDTITITRLEAFVGNTGLADVDPGQNPATTMRAIQTAVAAGAMLPCVA